AEAFAGADLREQGWQGKTPLIASEQDQTEQSHKECEALREANTRQKTNHMLIGFLRQNNMLICIL
ncbi:MAG: hypothetical protein K6C94_07995, partial [Candidatus Gastranaerophilales bacterium]|nr:hypothetical protein [Candidatus Gastranaerophilales bacterium]